MADQNEDTLGKRIFLAIFCAILGGLGILIAEAIDYYFWGFAWFEADSFVEYLKVLWFIPGGVAILCGLSGFFLGEEAVKFAVSFWRHID